MSDHKPLQRRHPALDIVQRHLINQMIDNEALEILTGKPQPPPKVSPELERALRKVLKHAADNAPTPETRQQAAIRNALSPAKCDHLWSQTGINVLEGQPHPVTGDQPTPMLVVEHTCAKCGALSNLHDPELDTATNRQDWFDRRDAQKHPDFLSSGRAIGLHEPFNPADKPRLLLFDAWHPKT